MAERVLERRLALEIRSWKFGFAVLEAARILEWGLCRFPPGQPETAIRRLAFLLKTYEPSVVITRRTRRARHGSSQNAARVLRMIRTELERRSIQFAIIPRPEVRAFFAEHGYGNKHEIAEAVADQFGELKARVPRSRKAWDPERGMVAVFDAVATSIAFEAQR